MGRETDGPGRCVHSVRLCQGSRIARVAEQFIRLARQAGKPVIVDPKGTNYAKDRGATLVKPNLHEAERFLNREIHDEAVCTRLAGA